MNGFSISSFSARCVILTYLRCLYSYKIYENFASLYSYQYDRYCMTSRTIYWCLKISIILQHLFACWILPLSLCNSDCFRFFFCGTDVGRKIVRFVRICNAAHYRIIIFEFITSCCSYYNIVGNMKEKSTFCRQMLMITTASVIL